MDTRSIFDFIGVKPPKQGGRSLRDTVGNTGRKGAQYGNKNAAGPHETAAPQFAGVPTEAAAEAPDVIKHAHEYANTMQSYVGHAPQAAEFSEPDAWAKQRVGNPGYMTEMRDNETGMSHFEKRANYVRNFASALEKGDIMQAALAHARLHPDDISEFETHPKMIGYLRSLQSQYKMKSWAESLDDDRMNSALRVIKSTWTRS